MLIEVEQCRIQRNNLLAPQIDNWDSTISIDNLAALISKV